METIGMVFMPTACSAKKIIGLSPSKSMTAPPNLSGIILSIIILIFIIIIPRAHLSVFHKEHWKDIVTEEEKITKEKEESVKNATKKKDDFSQPKIQDSFNKFKKVDPNGAKQSTYDKRLLEFLACTFVPFNVVDSEEFKRFVEELDKTINTKTSRTYSRQMEKFSDEVLEDVKKAVKKFCDASAAITTDLWTSRAMDSYISITVHFIDDLFRLHRWTPFCSPFADRHTGENIQEVVDMDIEVKLDIPPSLPKWGVSDNASNMVKALDLSITELYTCLCHTQQLAITDTFKELKSTDGETMEDIASKCQKLAAHLHRADISRKLLFDECEVTDHYPKAVPTANETRWDSTHECMETMLYHEECFMRLARRGELVTEDKVTGERRSLIPSINDFIMIKAAVKVLQKCKETTKLFEQEKIPTIPLVTERLYTVDNELEEIIKDPKNQRNSMIVKFTQVLREKLQTRFPNFGTDRMLNCFGNYLNPSLKGLHLKMLKILESTKEELEEKLGDWKVKTVEEEEESDDDPDEVTEPPAKLSVTEMLKRRLREEEEKTRGLRMTIRNSAVFSNTATDSSTMSRFRKECLSYEALPDASSDVDQLDWWKQHKEQFPLLSFLVRVVFAVPVASSKSERVFSVAGRTVTAQRANMNPEKVQDIVIVNTNLRILREMGLRK